MGGTLLRMLHAQVLNYLYLRCDRLIAALNALRAGKGFVGFDEVVDDNGT